MDLPIAMGFLCSTSATPWNRAVTRPQERGQKLSKQNFIDALGSASQDSRVRVDIVGVSSQMTFGCMDGNGDNQISVQEFQNFLQKVWEVPEADAIKAFEVLDADADGHLSRREFIRSAREHFHRHDQPAAEDVLAFVYL